MALSFSANHQSLSLTSCNSPFLSALSLCNLHSIRARFLGCGHNLRPPGPLRSRKKCKKLGLLRVHSPRFIFKASLVSHSIVVIVVVVTLSAVSLLFFSHSRRKKNAKEIQGRPAFALSQGSNVGNQVYQTQVLDFKEFQRDDSLKEVVLSKESTTEMNHVFEDKEGQLPFWRSSVVRKEAIVGKTSDSSSEVLVSSANASTSNDSMVVDQSFLTVAYQSSSFEPPTLAEKVTELQEERSQDEVDSKAELLIIMDESKSTAASVDVDNALKTADEHAKKKSELDAIHNDVLFGKSDREELYMFYEVSEPPTGSMLPLSGLKPPSPHA